MDESGWRIANTLDGPTYDRFMVAGVEKMGTMATSIFRICRDADDTNRRGVVS